MKKLLILFVMAFAMNVVAQESTLLRLNYKKGDVYTMDMKMSQDMGTMMSVDMSIKISQKITSVTGDEFVSEMKITQIAMDMSQGGNNISYDSSKSDDELDASGMQMKAQMGPMMDAVITSKGNNLGKVLETTVVPNAPGTSDLAKQSNSVEYPKEAVKVGSSWTMTKSDKGMNLNFVYTVKSITRTTVLLDVSGEVSGAASGKITGNMVVNKKSGVPTSSKIDMDMSVQGMDLKTNMVMTMTKQ